jgi:SAM-dependent methyltransferase
VADGSGPAIFRCPACGEALPVLGGGAGRCPACGENVALEGGVFDFVRDELRAAERTHYDEVYTVHAGAPDAHGRDTWTSLYYPMNRTVRERVGEVRGRTVLLLGNGTSTKELALLEQEPALLVVSDLSAAALRPVQRQARDDPRVVFAAIDALDLPISDASVDVVYGYAFVHHLPDVASFIAEAARVLRPGGRCVFMDDAYSPLWQGAKTTLLRPLMRYFHRVQPPSPEDLRFTLGGGFREEELAAAIRAVGCNPWFERSGFVHYLVVRASERLPPRTFWRAVAASDALLRMLVMVDDRLARIKAMRRNLIRLVWGFDKPADVF